MNRADPQDVAIKEERLWRFLAGAGYDAAVIGRADTFAWLTGGGENRVIHSTETGFSLLMFAGGRKHLVSLVADGPRVMEEELEGLGYEPEFLHWYAEAPAVRAMALAGGGRVLSDLPLPGADCRPDCFTALQTPLTPKERERCRILGRMTDEVLAEAAGRIRPGMTELQVQGLLAGLYAERDIALDVLLIGSDARIGAYRHCLPSPKTIESVVLLSPAIRKWGLHANVARMVCFGSVPAQTRQRFEAVTAIEAEVLSLVRPGMRFRDILERQKALYAAMGWPEEWRLHYQGGTTGYHVSDPTLCQRADAVLVENQVYDWFITITGAKAEELSLHADGRLEVPSVTGAWPTRAWTRNGVTRLLPELLVL